VDKGSTFSFTVPIYQNQQSGASTESMIKKDKIVIFEKNNP